MNRRRRTICLALPLLAVAIRLDAQTDAALRVLGDVEAPLALTVDDLRKLPSRRFDDRRGGEMRSYTGVLLRDVLNRAKPLERQPRGFRRSIVVATARDGYKAIFSWAELYLSPIGDGAYVVYERDGAPLQAGEGPLALVSLVDTSPGARHVRWLESVELRLIGN